MIMARDLDASLLRAFVAIVDAGSFGRAAHRLNRTQSALSMQIKRLEGLVATPLFDRTVRPATLTASGEALIPYARDILATNDAAVDHLRADAVAGQVRLALMEDYASTHLAPILGDFLAAHPGVQVEVHTGITAHFVEDLGSRYDLLLTMSGADVGDSEPLYRGKTLWAAHPSFDVKSADPLPLALYPQGCPFRKWAVGALDAADRRWRYAMMSPSLNTVAEAVRAGWCISVFKDCAFPAGLVALGEGDGLPSLPDYELRLLRAPFRLNPAARRLADHLTERVRADTRPTPRLERARAA
ncbi:MAG: LysR substrate-binding domain-containing protein [Devosia sp.]